MIPKKHAPNLIQDGYRFSEKIMLQQKTDRHFLIALSKRVMNSLCPGRILRRASAGENHAARSTSGNAALRPLLGGHSSSNRFDISVEGSKSPSRPKAVTIFRPG